MSLREFDCQLIDTFMEPVRRGLKSVGELDSEYDFVGERQLYRWKAGEYPKTKLNVDTRRGLIQALEERGIDIPAPPTEEGDAPAAVNGDGSRQT